MLIRGKCKFFFVIPAYETSCLIFRRQWYWITFLSWPLCCKQLKFPGNVEVISFLRANRRMSTFRSTLKELGFVFLNTNGKAQNKYKQNPVIGKETQK